MTLVLRPPVSPVLASTTATAEKMAQAMERLPSAIGSLPWRRRPGVTVIGPDTVVRGFLDSRGAIEIFGQVRGEVTCHHVLVQPGALVEGAIIADKVEVRGTVNGPVTALEVSVSTGARLFGKITHHHLDIEPGALTQGLQPWQPAQFFTG